MTDSLREVRTGLARTGRYLLSHHRPAEWDRCHALCVRGRTVRLCARCTGVYPGVLIGLVLFATGSGRAAWPWIVGLLPAPALVDWAVTASGERSGRNAVRTATGALLGIAYGVALPWVLLDGTYWLVGVAVVYGGLAALGLWSTRRT